MEVTNNTLRDIKEVSNQVDTGSDEVAAVANDLAAGTGEQASAVEELMATIEAARAGELDNLVNKFTLHS